MKKLLTRKGIVSSLLISAPVRVNAVNFSSKSMRLNIGVESNVLKHLESQYIDVYYEGIAWKF